MLGLIHYNPFLPHQVDHAKAFEKCGFKATPKPGGEADVHVISGPHFAYREWLGKPNVLMIDRAWWGDPNSVSIGWLQADGTRVFATGDEPRPHPEPQRWKTRRQSALILADFEQDVSELMGPARRRFSYVRVRRHPAERVEQVSLTSHLALSDVAIGGSTSALFDAVMAGVPSICLDPDNPVAEVCAPSMTDALRRPDRTAWLHKMSYAQFTLDEIADGTAWELLNGRTLQRLELSPLHHAG